MAHSHVFHSRHRVALIVGAVAIMAIPACLLLRSPSRSTSRVQGEPRARLNDPHPTAPPTAVHPWADDELTTILADLRARGEPVTLEELWGHDIGTSDNGMRDLNRALEWIGGHLPSDWRERSLGPWTKGATVSWCDEAEAGELAELGELLGLMAPAHAHIDLAATRRIVALPIRRWEDGTYSSVESVERFETIVHVLEARGHASMSIRSRVSAIHTSMKLGRLLQVRSSVEGVIARMLRWGATRSLRRLLADGSLAPVAALEQFGEEFQPYFRQSVRELLRAEALVCLSDIQGLVAHDIPLSEQAYGVARWRAMDAASRVPDPYSDDYLSRVRAAVEAATDDELARRHGFFTTRTLLRWDAPCVAAAAALRCLAYRESHGEWPKTAEDLGDARIGAGVEIVRDGNALKIRAEGWHADESVGIALGWIWLLGGD